MLGVDDGVAVKGQHAACMYPYTCHLGAGVLLMTLTLTLTLLTLCRYSARAARCLHVLIRTTLSEHLYCVAGLLKVCVVSLQRQCWSTAMGT